MRPLRRTAAAVFAGDPRVWKTAAIAAVPFLALIAFYCLRPRPYYTGTNSVEELAYLARTPSGVPICTPKLELPAGTAMVRLRVRAPTRVRPPLRLALSLADGQTIHSRLPAQTLAADRISNADFPIPERPAHAPPLAAELCAQAVGGSIEWSGTPLAGLVPKSPNIAGKPLPAQLAIWYLPPSGSERSLLSQAGSIFARAALFRPGIVGSWTYPLLLLLVLPALALAALRCLALALARRRFSARRAAAWLFAIAALNFCCWALITPAFQAPDEVDHFAYTQALVERGEGPVNNPAVHLAQWSGAEALALEYLDFYTDHQVGDSKPPWLAGAQREYEREVARLHPRRNDAGGYSTAASHGPLYYLALAPAYAAARGASVFAQLTLMRMLSAVFGALVAVFAFLLVRELAPRRPWLAVLAGLLVAYEPMYGFISGAVNNDVGVNAAAAALELLLFRLLRRGVTIGWGALTGAVLVAVPLVKGTGESLYPVAALMLLAAIWRRHDRAQAPGWIALAVGALAMDQLSVHVLSTLQPPSAGSGFQAIGSNAGAVEEALHHIPDFLAYMWQSALPRLPGMAVHFSAAHPGYTIFIERGWAAFGWYDVLFPQWVYLVTLATLIASLGLGVLAARREWEWVRRNWVETLALLALPVAVVAGFDAAYYSPAPQGIIPEFGRYLFPAMLPLAALAVAALHGFGRARMVYAGVAVLVAMLALSYASQLLTLTSFYA